MIVDGILSKDKKAELEILAQVHDHVNKKNRM